MTGYTDEDPGPPSSITIKAVAWMILVSSALAIPPLLLAVAIFSGGLGRWTAVSIWFVGALMLALFNFCFSIATLRRATSARMLWLAGSSVAILIPLLGLWPLL